MPRSILLCFLTLCGLLPGVGCDSQPIRSGCPDGQRYFRGQCLDGYEVRLNSVGYLPSRTKIASFVSPSDGFAVRSVDGDQIVLEGEVDGPTLNPDTDEQLYHADITELASGRYYLEIEGGKSHEFRVGRSPLIEMLDVTMLGLYGQRCGQDVAFEYGGANYSHAACHLEPASFERIGEGTRDDVGGWHDAGDYGKYTRNGAFAVYFLVRAYEQFPELLSDHPFEIPETGDETPDILDEARVELEWLLKVQLDDGSFSHKVTKVNFEVDIMPTADIGVRHFVSGSTTSTGNSVAVLAQAGRVYRPFDRKFAQTCLEAARRGQDFLDAHPESIGPDQSDINTGAYGCSTVDCGDEDSDERLWALVELWETTGDPDYLRGAEALIRDAELRANFDWADTENLGIVTYALSDRPGRDPDLLRLVRWEIQRVARFLRDNSLRHGYGRAFDYYYWGANGSLARTSYNLVAAHRLAPDTSLLDALTAQIDHLFGHNAYSRSFVTGMGADPVRRPHHRPSIADAASAPWPGLLIGGPHSQGTDDPIAQEFPALAWTDEAANYWHNEVAINWNTALAYALSAALATEKDASAACQPDCLKAPPSSGMGGAGGLGGATGTGGTETVAPGGAGGERP